jgi:hypothetical protein
LAEENTSGLVGVSTLDMAAPGQAVKLEGGLEGASSRAAAAEVDLRAAVSPGAPAAAALRGGRASFSPEEARQAGQGFLSSRPNPRNQGSCPERRA